MLTIIVIIIGSRDKDSKADAGSTKDLLLNDSSKVG